MGVALSVEECCKPQPKHQCQVFWSIHQVVAFKWLALHFRYVAVASIRLPPDVDITRDFELRGPAKCEFELNRDVGVVMEMANKTASGAGMDRKFLGVIVDSADGVLPLRDDGNLEDAKMVVIEARHKCDCHGKVHKVEDAGPVESDDEIHTQEAAQGSTQPPTATANASSEDEAAAVDVPGAFPAADATPTTTATVTPLASKDDAIDILDCHACAIPCSACEHDAVQRIHTERHARSEAVAEHAVHATTCSSETKSEAGKDTEPEPEHTGDIWVISDAGSDQGSVEGLESVCGGRWEMADDDDSEDEDEDTDVTHEHVEHAGTWHRNGHGRMCWIPSSAQV